MLAVAAAPARGTCSDRSASFIEAVLGELHAEALAIAMIASAASSLQKLDAKMDVPLMNKEAPDAATLLDLMTCSQLGEATAFDELNSLEGYTDTLARARSCLAELTRDVRKLGYVRAATVHAYDMAETWSEACRSAEAVVAETFDALPAQSRETYRENVFVLRSLLRSAASGMRPCLDDNHKLFKPRLPQQRRWPRKPLLEDCQLAIGDHLSGICIVDISAGGAGLAHVPQLEVGQPVAVVLKTGRTLSGRVAWTNEGQAGIEFSKPLHPTDTLLRN